MEYIYIVILLILILIIIKLIFENDKFIILSKDYDYFEKFLQKKNSQNNISQLINNNKLQIPLNKKNKILFITYDNRYKEEYVLIHNYNLKKYVEQYDYEYKYYNRCNENVYWCKIYMVLDAIKKNRYDYVVWLDSDTVIKNFNIDIGLILNMFSSDIFIGSDNNNVFDISNAGVFIISNSNIGINFLNDCINYVSDKCINNDGTLKGIWAGSCYEQGVMNILIVDKYFKYTTLLSNDIIYNYNICSDNVFIMHMYGSSPENRVKCFYSNNPAVPNSNSFDDNNNNNNYLEYLI